MFNSYSNFQLRPHVKIKASSVAQTPPLCIALHSVPMMYSIFAINSNLKSALSPIFTQQNQWHLSHFFLRYYVLYCNLASSHMYINMIPLFLNSFTCLSASTQMNGPLNSLILLKKNSDYSYSKQIKD